MFGKLTAAATLALLAAIPSVAAHGCPRGEFWWSGENVCLANGGPKHAPSPPKGYSCPTHWYWNTPTSSCAPRSLPAAPTNCPTGKVWDSHDFYCHKPQCKSNQFYYKPLSTCLPIGGPRRVPTPPRGTECPADWYWYSNADCCAPMHEHEGKPQCARGWAWDAADLVCKQQCRNNEFWWEPKSVCIPHGGLPPNQPPHGKNCPSEGWSWSHQHGCCTPHHPPPPPPPRCPWGWKWNGEPLCCEPSGPQPSNGYHAQKRHQRREISLCPPKMEACPVAGLVAGDYDCIDTSSEQESCGGCVSLGKGKDCTAIEGAWNVGCNEGSCTVYTCQDGYKVSSDGQSCDKL